jgi:hypothetical protein
VPVTVDGRVQENNTLLEWCSCTACNLAGEAGRGEGTLRKGMQSDKRAAMNIRRSGIAEMKGKERPYDLQNIQGSL